MSDSITGLGFGVGLATGVVVTALAKYLFSLSDNKSASQQLTSPATTTTTSGSTVVDMDKLRRSNIDITLARLENEFGIPSQRLQAIVKSFANELKKGLADDNQMFLQIPSFVSNRPTGTELGSYLALDLGGTNFRVCEVLLEGQGRVRIRQKKYPLTEELKSGSGKQLFDFFAVKVAEFLDEHGLPRDIKTTLGFTFSFPVTQTGINQGALCFWNKGFSCEGVVGHDVCELLQSALTRQGLNITVSALVNDTVGTLVAHAYTDPQTYVGIILGTGTNAAYVERVENITKWNGPIPPNGEMIMNTEWGGFNEPAVLNITKYDKTIDRASANPGIQVFEKLISGMYLGEITRQVIVDLISTGELFRGQSSPAINKGYSFETAFMSRIERDHTLELADTKAVLEDLLKVPATTIDDRRIVKRICELVGTRAARLSAAATAAIITKINKLDGCTVAIDGSLFEHYPHFANRMRDALHELLGLSAENIVLTLAHDGSGQGAALIAAVA
ncbi:uncharacterized protein BJ171DRAFT_455335 [Polychytrium aggregatum]|uniref:uncharacterized protein n=1 Tax=Polychytrium aggregatum TaxID=110093 RepID=UPI0022FE6AB9|nr:uncharacterized protein BJ171DRAFT_455335 [Polychytrium aggregatum]KAI9208095.1 hypothetical protein BJ171DRAFT_455335 [Polychytrium aggregatum]